MEIINACIDIYDERDYIYPETAGDIGTIFPEEFVIDNLNDFQNQGLEIMTKYMCVAFSTTHGCNILNKIEGGNQALYSGKGLGLKMVDLGRLNLTKGAAIQDGPKTARDEKWISGWFLVNENSIKQAIFDGHPVVVGSNSLDWSKITLESKSSSGHAILITGWNKIGWIIKESYGDGRWDHGRQYLPYALFDKLYPSKYALIDEPNPILLYKKKIMSGINIEISKKGFELGLWNGLDPTKPVTREECVAIAMRAIQKSEEVKAYLNK